MTTRTNKVFEISHTPKQHNTITLNGGPYCAVFDDRWATGFTEPRTWIVKLTRALPDSTLHQPLIQMEFLAGSSDVEMTMLDGRPLQLHRKGLIKKNFHFTFEDEEWQWSKDSGSWILSSRDDTVIANRTDTGAKTGITSRLEVFSSNLPEEVVLATGLSIGSAGVEGGILTSKPPNGVREFGWVSGVNTTTGQSLRA